MSIKVGIIGIGRMGITHFSIINSHPNVIVTAVADASGIMLGIIEKYISIKTYSDYTDLILISKPDAIIVCTPPNLHYAIIKKALEMNIHVFVEKPFTTNYHHSSSLANIAKGKNLINQVGYVNRFNDVFLKVRDFLNNGIIGTIIRFKSEMFSCTVTKSDEGSGWRSSRDSGGGAVYEMASHTIDLVCFLIGKPHKIIGSSLNSIYSKGVEDAISSTFLYANGITGTIYVNWSDSSYRKPTNKIEIFGTKGKILADQHSMKIFLNNANEQLNLNKGWNSLFITDIFTSVPFYVRGNEFTRQLLHFIDCIEGKSNRNNCTFDDGANTLDVIEKIFDDFETNGRIF